MTAVTELTIDLPLFRKGKVRNVYDLGDTLLLVATDRVSAFDCILPNGIPNKGKLLTAVSAFWFETLSDIIPHHLISTDVDHFPAQALPFKEQLRGRTMWVKKTQRVDVECVARGYLAGSGWKDYQKTGHVSGIELPKGLPFCGALPHPIFTPSTKADEGHDETISFEQLVPELGQELATRLKTVTLSLYTRAHEIARQKGIILADTKFEFGMLDGQLVLIDEALTPDSSRYWPADEYQPGVNPPSYDKQLIRDYLETCGWDKQPPAPQLPLEIIEKTSAQYSEIFKILTT